MLVKISDYIYAYSNVEREGHTFLGSSAKKNSEQNMATNQISQNVYIYVKVIL